MSDRHTEPGRVPAGARRLWLAFQVRPVVVSLAVAMVPLGLTVILLGAEASRAFTVLGGNEPARLIGLLLFTGGVLKLTGIFTLNSFTEAIGASLGLGGFLLYGGGCYLGLGINGIISGTLATSIAVGMAGRVLLLTTIARQVTNGGR